MHSVTHVFGYVAVRSAFRLVYLRCVRAFAVVRVTRVLFAFGMVWMVALRTFCAHTCLLCCCCCVTHLRCYLLMFVVTFTLSPLRVDVVLRCYLVCYGIAVVFCTFCVVVHLICWFAFGLRCALRVCFALFTFALRLR